MKQVQKQEQMQRQNQQVKTLCAWCLSNSGRINIARPCCALRELANSPRAAQAAYAKGLTEDQRSELRPRLLIEMTRLKQLRNAARMAGTMPPRDYLNKLAGSIDLPQKSA